jgi:hypothetical protein
MFKEILTESKKGANAVKALRKLNFDIDGAIDPESEKDIEKVINNWLKDGKDAIGADLELEGKELDTYMKYLKDIKNDTKSAWEEMK